MNYNDENYLGWVGTATALASALGKGIGSITKAAKKKKAKRKAAAHKKIGAMIRKLKAKVKAKQEAGELPLEPAKLDKIVKKELKKSPLTVKKMAMAARGVSPGPVERVDAKRKLDTMRRGPAVFDRPVMERAVIPSEQIIERERAVPGYVLPAAIGAGLLLLLLTQKRK